MLKLVFKLHNFLKICVEVLINLKFVLNLYPSVDGSHMKRKVNTFCSWFWFALVHIFHYLINYLKFELIKYLCILSICIMVGIKGVHYYMKNYNAVHEILPLRVSPDIKLFVGLISRGTQLLSVWVELGVLV